MIVDSASNLKSKIHQLDIKSPQSQSTYKLLMLALLLCQLFQMSGMLSISLGWPEKFRASQQIALPAGRLQPPLTEQTLDQ